MHNPDTHPDPDGSDPDDTDIFDLAADDVTAALAQPDTEGVVRDS